MEILKRSDILKKIQEAGDQIFSIKFIKKDGTDRTIVGKCHVTVGVTNLSEIHPEDLRASINRPQQDAINNTLTVYDMNKIEEGKETKGAFRRVNLKTVYELKVNGTIYKVED